MQVTLTEVGKRGILFSFKKPYFTNVYAILADNAVFIIDTFLGPEAMELVKEAIEKKRAIQRYIILNSHADYDHFWGNQSFKGSDIYAHEMAYHRIQREGRSFLQLYNSHQLGEVVITKPNILFTDQVYFIDERVLFFYSPGHTDDSVSVYDIKDRVLFVGDNIEKPIPYVYSTQIDRYIETLKDYLNYTADYIISGHDPIMTDTYLIEQNITYLTKLSSFSVSLDDLTSSKHQAIHWSNLISLAQRTFEENDHKFCKKILEHAQWFLDHISSDIVDINTERARIDSMLKKLQS